MTTKSSRPADVPCPVVLVTGFLGSGKTTLLRELLNSLPAEIHSVVLMNEFGKVGIDGPLLGEELDIVEVNRGSIFCACAKGDFLKALNRIARDFDADLLFVEASGIADPSDFERDLNRPEIASAFVLSEHLCVIDATRFLKWAELFAACEKQARAARVFVLNKCDEVTEADLRGVEALLAKWNPKAPVYRTSFGRIDPRKVLPEILQKREGSRALWREEEIEAVIDAFLTEPGANLIPPDPLLAEVVSFKGPISRFLEAEAHLPEDLVRAKGFLKEGSDWYLYQRVGEAKTLSFWEKASPPFEASTVVFIRSRLLPQEIVDLLKRFGLDDLRSLL